MKPLSDRREALIVSGDRREDVQDRDHNVCTIYQMDAGEFLSNLTEEL